MYKKVKIVSFAFLIFCSLFTYDKLKSEEEGVETFRELVEQTPVIVSKPSGFSKGIIFIAHGYAGSTSLMSPIAVSLARAGYVTVRFDFFGHGEHPLPYYGSIVDVNGVTQLFVDQLDKIVNYYTEAIDHKKALVIGHSMASDIIFRVANANRNIYGAIGLSNYTNQITADKPKNVLIINGAWESRLRGEALKILKGIGIDNPKENQLYGSIRDGKARKALAIDNTGHISILYSAQTQRAINDWVNSVFGYEKDDSQIINYIGFWTLCLLSSLLLCFLALISIFPKLNSDKIKLNNSIFVLSIGSGTVLAPLMATYINFSFVPFMTHNYLIKHFFVFSIITSVNFLPIIKKFSVNKIDVLIFIFLLAFYIFIFGGILDRYVSSFFVYSYRLSTFFLFGNMLCAFSLVDSNSS